MNWFSKFEMHELAAIQRQSLSRQSVGVDFVLITRQGGY